MQEPGLETFLSRVARAFEGAGVEYAVVGSVASSFHGEPRMTRDLDVVARIQRGDVAALALAFPEEEFYFDPDMVLESLKTRQPFNIIDLSVHRQDDLVPTGCARIDLHHGVRGQPRPGERGGHRDDGPGASRRRGDTTLAHVSRSGRDRQALGLDAADDRGSQAPRPPPP